MRSLIVFLLSLSCLFIFSCNKGELPEAAYYSKVQIYNLSFPNSPDVDVRFDGKPLGTLETNRDKVFDLKTAQGKLQLYKANTDTLLADTLITLKTNEQQVFRFAYSKELGLEGFLSAGKPVSQDTVAFQILNNISHTTYGDIDFHIFRLNVQTDVIEETGNVIENFQNVGLYDKVYELPNRPSPNASPYIYLGRLWDRAKGEFVTYASGRNFFILPQLPGAMYIFSLKDDNGMITVTSISL
jgi:hypothetical protein